MPDKESKSIPTEASPEELAEYIERNRWKTRFQTILSDWRLYLMLVPLILVFFFWRYLPMGGLLIAFKKYEANIGVWNSAFTGFYWMRDLMFGANSSLFWQAFRNTFLLSFYGLVFGFPVPILLALFFSEIKSDAYRSVVQILSYLPKFISTVVVTTLVTLLLKGGSEYAEPGVLAQLLYRIGLVPEATNIMYAPKYFRAIYQVSGIWEGAGYGSIVYFAAIVGISPTNYEAARIDGANKLAQIRYVTIPGITTTLTIMLILRIGELLTVGYEKVLLLYNTYTYSTADVISTLVYRLGLVGNAQGLASAADLFNSIIAMLLVIGANIISRKVSDTSLY